MYKNKWAVMFYMLPALVLLIMFIYVPVFLNFHYSLYRWSAFSVEKVWVGFNNVSVQGGIESKSVNDCYNFIHKITLNSRIFFLQRVP
jgi:ABC-type sugar transport system permease subunit